LFLLLEAFLLTLWFSQAGVLAVDQTLDLAVHQAVLAVAGQEVKFIQLVKNLLQEQLLH
jgi:hypothetical protein